MKFADFTHGYDARSNITSFSYVVSKADQQFMGANSAGANVLYFKNLSADATVTLQLDNTFIATVGDDKVQVYVNVTQGQAANIGKSTWATIPVMQIKAVITTGSEKMIAVAHMCIIQQVRWFLSRSN